MTLSGSFSLDEKSDSIEPFLELMGVPWAIRKLVSSSKPRIELEYNYPNFTVKVCFTLV